MNCIIVDDDLLSTRIISDFIRRTSSLSLLKVFDNAIEAVDYFLSVPPWEVQIIFLDIEMPEMSGIDFLKSAGRSGTQVVIYSSQEKYALESYDYDVCDYLLKPVTYARFIKAVGKARTELEKDILTRNKELPNIEGDDEEEMFIKENSGQVYKIKLSDIIYLEALENYVAIETTIRRFTIHSTMKAIMDRLASDYIIRSHRSYAVAKRHVKSVVGNNVILELPDGEISIPIGKSYKENLKQMIESFLR